MPRNPLLILLFIILLSACSAPEEKENEEVEGVVQTTEAGEKFHYIPPEPVDGSLYGVIEIGGSGFNSFIVNLDEEGNWKLEKANYGESNVYEGQATLEALESGLEIHIERMLEQGVERDKIHIIQSSTATKDEKVQRINVALKELGFAIKSVDVRQEGVFAFKAIMPDSYRDNSFVLDIGSGNTKVSWIEAGEIKSIGFEGSKYYQNGLSDEDIYQAIKTRIKEIPKINTKYCFVIGGVPYELAKLDANYTKRYIELKEPEDYDDITDPKARAGINIYKALYDNLENCDAYIFDWDGNFSIGYLLSIH